MRNKRNKIPLFYQLQGYDVESFISDFIAGLVTAFIAIPQCMAYANLAGLPAEYGLYCSLFPLIVYAFLGSSRTLVVGPAAIISLMIANTLTNLAPETSEQAIEYAVNLSLLTGFFLLIFSVFRLGKLTNFISKPVINGFTTASVIVIIVSQLHLILGIEKLNGLSFSDLFSQIYDANTIVIFLSLSAFIVLWLSKSYFYKISLYLNFSPPLRQAFSKSGPVLAVILGSTLVFYFDLAEVHSVKVVGNVPSGLPSFSISLFKPILWPDLLLPASSIALICFLTSLAVGMTMATKDNKRIDSNQELMALGMSNVISAFTGTFAVAGSISRSMTNYVSGAKTQVANIISAIIVMIALIFFTDLFYFLPNSVLGVIVIMSVIPMIDVVRIHQCWVFNKADACSLLTTLIGVLVFGVEYGIWIGVVCSMILLVYRSSKPHIAVLGKVHNSDHFRNTTRLDVETLEIASFLRIDESLYFANIQHVENFIMKHFVQYPKLRHVVLVFNSVNFVDESALETLKKMINKLSSMNVTLHLSEVKGVVNDQLKLTDLYEKLAPGKVFYTTSDAMLYIKFVGKPQNI
jgi:SulP family sulfate permease